ncbi:LytR/AlgR family response regulator transcription factor [Dokdonia sp. Hel_I_53]|uniref:LytR/AlgR family response regulator transcription factor n=1 Tax=Dokdonia sp. Hel_I_53 TaxID=1566287 RepID=UPI00119ABEA3|nr:LytTR family DNA-binding domain-containing protein [Dokdonia sp. Hel_I_53]TVZ53299.1 LytTR family two component transcriptional regulator [Dokdonia sp. Hel_I_53]
MSTYNAIIIDDEPMAREILEEHLSKIDQITVVAQCKNAAEGFSALSKYKVDLVFLDINMPEVSGIMFAKAIQGKTKVIFTTAYREYAVEGFDIQAVDYLLKPISLERLMKALQKFYAENIQKETPQPTEDFTFFRSDRKMVKVNFNDIFYIESLGDYIKVHTTNGTITTRETMNTIVEKLPKHQFLRTHRSFIIAIAKISSFTNEHLIVDKKVIPISRSYREAVLQRLDAY